MRRFEEYNIFVQVGKLFALWHESGRRRRISFCPKNRAGHHATMLQLPRRIVTILCMALALFYLPLWLFAAEFDLWGGGLADFLDGYLGFVFAAFSLFILVLGSFFLRIQYTLTDTELIVRRFRQRHINLEDLRQWNLISPPQAKAGRNIRLTSGDSDHITLRFLRAMEGGTHFVMLLSEATKLPLIELFLNVDLSEK